LIGLAGGFTLDLYSFLFGSILLVSPQDTLTILVLSAAVLSIISVIYRKLLYVTFDEQQARVSGIQVTNLNYLFIVLASITVITSIRLVGVLLISSLVVIPNITAIIFGKGFKKTLLISFLIAVYSVLGGIIISYYLNLAPGGTIVLMSIATFFATLIVKHSIIAVKRRSVKTITTIS
jgi:zinc transport system permease protein